MPVQSLGLQLVLQQSFAELIPHISTLGQCNVPGEQGLGPKPRGHLCFSWQSGWGALYWCQVVAPEAAVGLTGVPWGAVPHKLISAPFTPGCCRVRLDLQIQLISQVMGSIA